MVPKIRQQLVARDRSLLVPTASALMVEVNLNRSWVAFVNVGANVVFLRLGAPAVANEGIPLLANGGSLLLDMVLTPWYGEIEAIAVTAASQVTCQEVEGRV